MKHYRVITRKEYYIPQFRGWFTWFFWRDFEASCIDVGGSWRESVIFFRRRMLGNILNYTERLPTSPFRWFLGVKIMSKIKKNDWVVCIDSFGNPSTWGKVRSVGGSAAEVTYGRSAAIWNSSLWSLKYLTPYPSERKAKAVVDAFEKNIPNR